MEAGYNFELSSANVVLKPNDPQKFSTSGDCGTAVRFKGETTIAGNVLKIVTDSLFEHCIDSPHAEEWGGTPIGTPPSRSRKTKRSEHSELSVFTRSSDIRKDTLRPFPLGMKVALYLKKDVQRPTIGDLCMANLCS